MSRYACVATRAISDSRLLLSDLRVLAVLGSYMDSKTFECTPSRSSIEEATGLSRATVKRVIGRLEGFGYLTIQSRQRDNNGHSSNKYTMVMGSDEPRAGLEAVSQGGLNQMSQGGAHTVSPAKDNELPTLTKEESVADAPLLPIDGSEVAAAAPEPPASRKALLKERKPQPCADGFDDLWAIWKPKDKKPSTARKPSLEAYIRALRLGADPKQILAGAKAYLADAGWDKDGGRFMKGLVPFLNQEIWRDLLAQAGPKIHPNCVNPTIETQRALVSHWVEGMGWASDAGPFLACISDSVLREFGVSRNGERKAA